MLKFFQFLNKLPVTVIMFTLILSLLYQTESVIQMLMTASELIPTGVESHKHRHRHLVDAHTLVRVLCHKKDKEASQFLKLHYQLPASSGGFDLQTYSFHFVENLHESFIPARASLLRYTTVTNLLSRYMMVLAVHSGNL